MILEPQAGNARGQIGLLLLADNPGVTSRSAQIWAYGTCYRASLTATTRQYSRKSRGSFRKATRSSGTPAESGSGVVVIDALTGEADPWHKYTGLYESRGDAIAQMIVHGGVLMHCLCRHHSHGDARPSIEIQPAKNVRRYGYFIIHGYAPSCLFYTEHGCVTDAFSAYCKLMSLDPREAVRQLT